MVGNNGEGLPVWITTGQTNRLKLCQKISFFYRFLKIVDCKKPSFKSCFKNLFKVVGAEFLLNFFLWSCACQNLFLQILQKLEFEVQREKWAIRLDEQKNEETKFDENFPKNFPLH